MTKESSNAKPNTVKQTAPFGSWKSPISADLLSAASVALSEIHADGEDIYWLESRPQEKGRSAIVRYGREGRCDVLPTPLNARSKVNEYGGGSYCVHHGVVYFVLFDDQRIYSLDTRQDKASPEAITPESQQRFGDLQYDQQRNRLIAVCEDHTHTGQEAETYLVSIDLDGKSDCVSVLHKGADFYSSPRLSPNGKQLTWISWNHPNMPWDGSECWLADLAESADLINPRRIAGGEQEAIVQPQFSPDNVLYFVSDRSNWWNLYCYQQNPDEKNSIKAICPQESEFAGPHWVFGQSHYSFVDQHSIVGALTQEGRWQLYHLNIASGQLQFIDSPCSDIAYLKSNKGKTVFVGAGAKSFEAVYQLSENKIHCLAESAPQTLSNSDLSASQSIRFPLSTRPGEGQAFYYPPANCQFQGPDNSAPPVLVFCHGGPTSATRSSLHLKVQYWTSRGIAVVDVNYGGSTGFGREYRQSLNQQWGVVDVNDCVDCVNALVERGLADKNSLAIRGGSAGGYTVLCALAFHKVFKAGASHYGVGDLETLATDTHKFESRYLDSLIGPYPEQKGLYQQRSPINHLDQLNCPVIFFQGMQDKVVPPNQAQAMVEALDKKKITHAYVTFEEEGHGFRQAANQRRAIEAELYFYSRVFGFELADEIEPVEIKHL